MRARLRAEARPGSTLGRLLAYLIDLVVVLGAGGLTWWVAGSVVVAVIVVLEACLIILLGRAATGLTVGSWATRTVAIADAEARAPGLRRQAIRSAIMGPLHLTVVGPLITECTAREGRDWIDGIAGTRVMDRTAEAEPVVARDPYGRPTVIPSLGPPGLASGSSTAATDQGNAPESSGEACSAELLPADTPPGIIVIADTGARLRVAATLVIGRAPQPGGPSDVPWVLPDPGRSLSRTHLRLGWSAPVGLWVEDAGSSNGTRVQTGSGTVHTAPPGERLSLSMESTLLLGDHVLRFEQVEAPVIAGGSDPANP